MYVLDYFKFPTFADQMPSSQVICHRKNYEIELIGGVSVLRDLVVTEI